MLPLDTYIYGKSEPTVTNAPIGRFFPGPDFTHSYFAHFLTLISIPPTLIPYLLSPTDTTTLITSYPIELATVLTTYPTNLATLLITYPTLKTLP